MGDIYIYIYCIGVCKYNSTFPACFSVRLFAHYLLRVHAANKTKKTEFFDIQQRLGFFRFSHFHGRLSCRSVSSSAKHLGFRLTLRHRKQLGQTEAQ